MKGAGEQKRLTRAQYSALNVGTNLLFYVVRAAIGFYAQRVFFSALGLEYRGINDVLMQIMDVLTLAELGVGTGILVSLYGPMAQGDTQKAAALAGMYRRIYRWVALAVGVGGLALMPLLPLFIDADVNMLTVRCALLLFIANAVINYLFVHRANVVTADQRGYVVGIARGIGGVVGAAAQIAVLLVTGNYLLFLLVNTVSILVQNLVIARQAGRLYPFLRQKRMPELPSDEKKALFARARAVFLHDIGGKCVNSTDSLIVNGLLGNTVGGVFAYYIYVVNILRDVLRQIFASINSSVGNLLSADDENARESTYKNVMFMNFWLYGFAATGLGVLARPFVHLWISPDATLSAGAVLALAINFYIGGMRECSQLFKTAAGHYQVDRYLPLVEAGINLVVSVALARVMGVAGVVLGTLISTLAVPFWTQPYYAHKLVLRRPMGPYWRRYALYLAAAALGAGLTYWVCSAVILGSAPAQLAFGFLACMIIPNALYALLFFKTPEFGYFWGLVGRLARRARRIGGGPDA